MRHQASTSGVETKPIELDWDAARRVWAGLSGQVLGTEPRAGADNEGMPEIPGYDLVGRLRRGGGGEVFEATRRHDGRRAVLKLIGAAGTPGPGAPFDLATAQRMIQAQREIGMHRHRPVKCIPVLLDSGTHEGAAWFAVQFIEGEHLDVWWKLAGLTPRQKAEKLVEVCDAVADLHNNQIFHGDLKPDNILITEGGEIFIIDYGAAARELDAEGSGPVNDEHAISARIVHGTPDFMAPELGRSGDQPTRANSPTMQSDVFSLGAAACLLLAGDTPRRIDPTLSASEAFRRVASEPIRDPAQLMQRSDKALAAVLRKALSTQPAARYPSAAQLGADLRRWANGQRVHAMPRGPFGRLWDWADRHPARAVIAGAVVLAAVILGGSSAWVWWTNQVPFALIPTAAHSARLIARSGAILAEWGGPAYAIPFARMTPRDPALGGGHIILIGSGPKFGSHDLTAFNADDPRTPLWRTGIGPGNFAYPPGSNIPDEPIFRFAAAELADVFPESPGDEVIVSHTHITRGACCVRVYDLNGRVLYEAWHYGHIYQLRWLSGPRLLVLLGVNSEANWTQRGRPDTDMTWPVVLLAVRPQMGQHAGWITSPSRPGDTPPQWYRCVMPPDLARAGELGNANTFTLGTIDPSLSRRFCDTNSLTLRIGVNPVVVDAEGNISFRPPLAHLQHTKGRHRDPEVYGKEADADGYFIDLPPKVPGPTEHGLDAPK